MFKRNKFDITGVSIAVFFVISCGNYSLPTSDLIMRMENAVYSRYKYALADSLCDVILTADDIPSSFYSKAVYVKRMNKKWDEGIMLAGVGLGKEVDRADSVVILTQLMEVFAASGRLREAIECVRTLNNKLCESDRRRFGVLYKLGDLYFDIADYDQALAYHTLAYRNAQERNDETLEQQAANELYFDNFVLGLQDSAIFYFEEYRLDTLYEKSNR